jgi:hypothetical protein
MALLYDFQRGLEPGLRSPGEVKGDVALGQRFGNQLSCVAAAAIDQNLA